MPRRTTRASITIEEDPRGLIISDHLRDIFWDLHEKLEKKKWRIAVCVMMKCAVENVHV